MIRIGLKFRREYEDGMGGFGVEHGQNKIHKTETFYQCIQRLRYFRKAQLHNFVFGLTTKLVTLVKLFQFIMSTYPMKYQCILQKYTFRPLLLLQLVPCHYIVSEMYVKPSHPRMHANNASRQNSRFVPQGKASFLKSSGNFRCFPQ